jgi:hypothetical protein
MTLSVTDRRQTYSICSCCCCRFPLRLAAPFWTAHQLQTPKMFLAPDMPQPLRVTLVCVSPISLHHFIVTVVCYAGCSSVNLNCPNWWPSKKQQWQSERCRSCQLRLSLAEVQQPTANTLLTGKMGDGRLSVYAKCAQCSQGLYRAVLQAQQPQWGMQPLRMAS